VIRTLLIEVLSVSGEWVMSSVQTEMNLIAFPQQQGDSLVEADGKFFRLNGKLWSLQGLTYGPFGQDPNVDAFGSREQALKDFEIIQSTGANTLRVYHVPPQWFMDMANEHSLKLWVDVPWGQHHAFLDSKKERKKIRQDIGQIARQIGNHPSLFALCIGNEISSELIRWQGASNVSRFLDELADQVHQVRPSLLCTYGNYPSTEYLHLQEIDFLSFNIYLHDPEAMSRYLARLQLLADGRPLVVGEFGMDTLSQTPSVQAHFLKEQFQIIEKSACAGSVVFAFTDEWHKDGGAVKDWAFGITDKDRQAKPSFEVLKQHYKVQKPSVFSDGTPMVSVVVAAYNAEGTLEPCLQSLECLDYPNYEVIIVDDGSQDNTSAIAKKYAQFNYVDLGSNRGLSAARNAGIRKAKGSIIAFTDADCEVDSLWLRFLVEAFENHDWAAVGGPNILPAEDGPIAAAVMATPGGPAHVMLTDQIAEHIPGCNMAFRAQALERVGAFDPQFRIAGDDVDLCWRLLMKEMVIGFAPGAFVWHHRRSTINAFLKQQMGYGRAESLLCRKFPSMFNVQGDHVWNGRIYANHHGGNPLETSRIYHGLYGYGAFQPMYGSAPSRVMALMTSIEYHLHTTLPLLIAGLGFPVLALLGGINVIATLIVAVTCSMGASIASDKHRWWSGLLLAWLHLLQPLARSSARMQQWARMRRMGSASRERVEALWLTYTDGKFDRVSFWNETDCGRPEFFARFKSQLKDVGWDVSLQTDWASFDAWLPGGLAFDLHVYSVDEFFKGGKRRVLFRLKPVATVVTRVTGLVAAGACLALIAKLGITALTIILLILTLLTGYGVYRYLRKKLLAECMVVIVETADVLGWQLLTDKDKVASEKITRT
jgi:GT2 family glycosyltransferase